MRQGSVDGEAVRFRDGRARHQPGAANPWRLRLHQGFSARALLARCAVDEDFRRYFRNPDAHHLGPPAAEAQIMSIAVAKLTGTKNYFEDFEVGAKMRHARGS